MSGLVDCPAEKKLSGQYAELVLAGARADLLIFTLLALPLLSKLFLDCAFKLGEYLGDTRSIPMLEEPFTQLVICLMGIFGLFTVWIRRLDPSVLVGRAVGTVKLVAAMLFSIAIYQGAPLILLVFLGADLINGALLLSRRSSS